MMAPGDEKILAERISQVLSARRTAAPNAAPKPPAGTHQGEFRARELAGSIDGDQVTFATRPAVSNGDNLSFRFSGTLSADSMAGSLDMGGYLTAIWTAKRHVPDRRS